MLQETALNTLDISDENCCTVLKNMANVKKIWQVVTMTHQFVTAMQLIILCFSDRAS